MNQIRPDKTGTLEDFLEKFERYLEYYAAECDEYHSLGEVYKSTNLDQILAKYREIIDDPTLSYYGNGMGIIIRLKNAADSGTLCRRYLYAEI